MYLIRIFRLIPSLKYTKQVIWVNEKMIEGTFVNGQMPRLWRIMVIYFLSVSTRFHAFSFLTLIRSLPLYELLPLPKAVGILLNKCTNCIFSKTKKSYIMLMVITLIKGVFDKGQYGQFTYDNPAPIIRCLVTNLHLSDIDPLITIV